MADIFISYSKQSKAETEHLAAELQAKGFTVWYDTSLVPGDSFRDVITSELAQARAAIVIWTADSVKFDWVCAEARAARERAAGQALYGEGSKFARNQQDNYLDISIYVCL